MFNLSKSSPVREFCAKFCDGTNLFFDGTSSRAPDHSSTLILPRGGSDPPPGRILPLAVPHLCDPQYSITHCQLSEYRLLQKCFCNFKLLEDKTFKKISLQNRLSEKKIPKQSQSQEIQIVSAGVGVTRTLVAAIARPRTDLSFSLSPPLCI